MPSAAFTKGLGRTPPRILTGRQLSPEVARQNPHIITARSFHALGVERISWGAVGAYSNQAMATANLAIAYPFEIAAAFLIRKVFFVCGVGAANSTDVAVYTEAGARVVSGGGTANVDQSMVEVDVTDTVIPPGRYWCAWCKNGTSDTTFAAIPAAQLLRAAGMAQMASAYPLPSTFTPAGIANPFLPLFGIASRTLI